MPKKFQIYFGMIFATTLILVISKLATNSLNPLEVFRGESLLLKIVVGFLCLPLLAGPMNLYIRSRWEDKRCAGTSCGRSLVEFAQALGAPVKCMHCARWYHKNCFATGGGTFMGGCKQPGCPSYSGAAA